MFSILILGKGFVGNSLFKHLSNYNSPVTFVNKESLDYTNEKELNKFLNYKKFNYVINCSGYTGSPNVDACEENKQDCYFYNVTVPTVIAKCCELNNAKFINVSSGCIFTGYEKNFSEDDIPNFGIFNSESSFYSKTKHICETILANYNSITLRIRMPICNYYHPKNLIQKVLIYNNLISLDNSATHLDDFNNFIFKLINHKDIDTLKGPFNVVNPGAISCKKIANTISLYTDKHPNWNFVNVSELPIKAQRSNCILSDKKIQSLQLGLRHIDFILSDAVYGVINSQP